MISIDKFKTLTEKTAIKKASVIVSSKIHDGISVLDDYSIELYKCLVDMKVVKKDVMESLISRVKNGENPILIAEYFKALSGLGDVSWDYISPKHSPLRERSVKNCYLLLDNIRSPYNVGAIFRSAESFGIKKIFLLGATASPTHPRAVRTACGCDEIVPYEYIAIEDLSTVVEGEAFNNIFALECGGKDINSFEFPSSGCCIIGSEEFGVSEELLRLSKAIVSIPMYGLKGSLNVSVAAGIALFKWFKA